MIKRILKRFSLQKKSSYLCGASNEPLIYKTIPQQLRDTVSKYPDNFAVYGEEENLRLTYAEFYEKSQKMACGLISLKLKNPTKARIGVFAPNLIDYYIAQMACSMADMILVNINPSYRENELKYALNKVQCEVLMMVSDVKTSNYDKMLRRLAPGIDTCRPGELKSEALPYLKYIIKMDNKTDAAKCFTSIRDIYEIGDNHSSILQLSKIEGQTKPEDITNIQFTSGTTGSPKAASLTHFGVLNNGRFTSKRLGLTEQDRILCSVPLYHCFGMVVCNMAAMTTGSEVLFPSLIFNAKKSLKVCSEKQATSIYGVPTMFLQFLNLVKRHPGKYDFSSTRTGVMAGAICPKSVILF